MSAYWPPNLLLWCLQIEPSNDLPDLEPEVPLASAQETGISGLVLLTDFVSAEEEEALLQYLGDPDSAASCTSAPPLEGMAAWERVSRRFVKHFGFRFDYASKSFSETLGPLPPLLAGVSDRISSLTAVGQSVDQVRISSHFSEYWSQLFLICVPPCQCRSRPTTTRQAWASRLTLIRILLSLGPSFHCPWAHTAR